MANEIRLQLSLGIQNAYLQYQSQPSSWQGTMVGTTGETPGLVTVTTDGVDVDLSQLTTPGMCWMINLDATNYVTWGAYDPETLRYYPLGKLPPGMPQLFHFAAEFNEEYAATGTGTVGPGTNRFRLKASTATCKVRVHAFDA